MAPKTTAQFYVAVASVVGITSVTAISLVIDQLDGHIEDVTMILAGGLISLCSAATAWLFKNGNGHTETKA
jgi:hypothetical protein